MIMEKKHNGVGNGESFIKGLVWRVTGIIWLLALTYLLTKNTAIAAGVAISHHTTCVFTYYLHERIWTRVKWALGKKRRSVIKSITYEIITCHIMLGLISWFFTHEAQQMALIPIIYVNSRIVMYYFYERIWRKFFSDN